MLIMKKIERIYLTPKKETLLECDSGEKIVSKCLNCKNKRCMYYENSEINSEEVQIPQNILKDVCPNNAIYEKNNEIFINEEKCIGCGLCASRCEIGAIFIDGSAKISKGVTEDRLDISNAIKIGNILEDEEKQLGIVYNKLKKNNINSNIFARNLLIQCGMNTYLSRKGDVSLRMDGIIYQDNSFGVLEVEFGNEVLDCPRDILDDIAILCSRYNYKKEKIYPLIISLSLPNNRTDYWHVINDIKNVLNIKIHTITIGALLIIMWNNRKLDIEQMPFLDSENILLKNNVEAIINKEINWESDEYSILNTIK